MKDVKEFLPYYLGQPCTTVRNDGKTVEDIVCLSLLQEMWIPGKLSHQLFTIKPHLRRLEDITPEEKERAYNYFEPGPGLDFDNESFTWWLHSDGFHYLLKQGFDLFGLCDAGLAIDSKTLNQ